MDPGVFRDALTLLGGIGTGVMSGLFGVGGAVISTPLIRALGCTAALAVGTTLPSILPGAITGSVKFSSEKLVSAKTVLAAAPPGIVASVVGSRVSHLLPGNGHPLMILTAALLLWCGISLLGTHSADALLVPAKRPAAAAALTGISAGLLSGLLGIGGGIVMVPMFRSRLGLAMRSAVATSLVCVGCFAIPGTIVHAFVNHDIDWRFASWLTVGVIPGAVFGAALALRVNEDRLKRLFGIFLLVISIVYGAGEIAALV